MLQSVTISKLAALCLTAVFIFIPIYTANAQVGSSGQLMRASVEDAQILAREYIRPYSDGLGSVSNTGWLSKAKSHSVLGFDVRFRFGAAAIPDNMGSMNVNELGLSNLRPENPSNSISPTISGENRNGPRMQLFDTITMPDGSQQDIVINEFNLPGGTGFSYTLAPMIQAGIGLPFNTDLMVRFVPTIDIGGYGEFGILGFGVLHEITQWLPFYSPIDISIMGGFTTIGVSGNMSIVPGSNDYDVDPDNLDTPQRWSNQTAGLDSYSWNANILAGKTIGPLSVFGGLGLQSAQLNLKMTGEFPQYEVRLNENFEPERVLRSVQDPIDIELNTDPVFRTFGGISMKLLLLEFTIEASYAEYPVVNAGIGFTFR
ncbi:MAG: hypothetical protein LAT67_12915 [Balneolales bacterium]|nr:hypothetical protein [Balneolales bacterium]